MQTTGISENVFSGGILLDDGVIERRRYDKYLALNGSKIFSNNQDYSSIVGSSSRLGAFERYSIDENYSLGLKNALIASAEVVDSGFFVE